MFISDSDASATSYPTKGAVDRISSPVAIPESVILSIDVAMVLSMRNKKVDALKCQTVVCPGETTLSANGLPWYEGLNLLPLLIGQIHNSLATGLASGESNIRITP